VTFTATVTLAPVPRRRPRHGDVLRGRGRPDASRPDQRTATFTIATLAAGSHTITATYNVAANFPATSSTSAPLTQVVNAVPIPPPPPVVQTGLYAVGSDAGIPAEVKVYNAATGALVFDLHPFGSFAGGARVAVGDVTGDGTPDIIIGAGPGGGPQSTCTMARRDDCSAPSTV